MYPWFTPYRTSLVNIDVEPHINVAAITQTSTAVALFGGTAVSQNLIGSFSQR